MLGTYELAAPAPHVRRRRRAGLSTAEILSVVEHELLTLRASQTDLVLEELGLAAAIRAFHVQYGVEAPFLHIVPAALSHGILLRRRMHGLYRAVAWEEYPPFG